MPNADFAFDCTFAYDMERPVWIHRQAFFDLKKGSIDYQKNVLFDLKGSLNGSSKPSMQRTFLAHFEMCSSGYFSMEFNLICTFYTCIFSQKKPVV